jgi:hydroxymethylpyrimidine pyrophosphatase-like HAD family hydrolase
MLSLHYILLSLNNRQKKQVSKKINGVLQIAREFNISKNEIIAFGDYTNDKEILLSCGLSVAMGNAIEDIKISTDYICDINDNDGIAKWLDENILWRNL